MFDRVIAAYNGWKAPDIAPDRCDGDQHRSRFNPAEPFPREGRICFCGATLLKPYTCEACGHEHLCTKSPLNGRGIPPTGGSSVRPPPPPKYQDPTETLSGKPKERRRKKGA